MTSIAVAQTSKSAVSRVSKPADCRPSSHQPIWKSAIHRLGCVLVLLAVAVVATAAEPTVKLTGIARVGERTMALVEIKSPGTPPLRPIVMSGDRVGSIEVVSIDANAAKASVKIGDNVSELSLYGADATGQAPVFRLKDAHSRQVLALYQELSGRTVFAPDTLPPATITAMSEGAPDAAAGALARALGDKGIVVDPRFDKFAFATEPRLVAKVEKLKGPPEAPKVGTRPLAPGEELFPPGLIKFSEAGTRQVLDILQELMGRTLIVSPILPAAGVTVKSQTPLSRAEAIWLLDAALQLNDVAVSLSGDKFAFVTTTKGAKRVAKFKTPPPSGKELSDEKFPPGLIKFNEADRSIVLDIYRELVGQSLLLAPDLPHSKVTLKSQTPLTRDEAVWLLESALLLRGIQCVPAGDKQIKVIRDPGADANQN